jgi:hypothetical protein
MNSSRSSVKDVMNMATSKGTAQRIPPQRKQGKKAGNRPGRGNPNRRDKEMNRQSHRTLNLQGPRTQRTTSVSWLKKWTKENQFQVKKRKRKQKETRTPKTKETSQQKKKERKTNKQKRGNNTR